MANKSNGNNGNNGNRPVETIAVSSRLERAVDSVDMALAGGSDVTLDFTTCDFITVDGLEWLEEVLFRSQSLERKVTFINLSPKLYKVFKVAHIDSLQKACGAPGPAT